jgi:hypothetical protein
MSATSAATNALAPTAPMNTGRFTALRARAVSHTDRGIGRGNSLVWAIILVLIVFESRFHNSSRGRARATCVEHSTTRSAEKQRAEPIGSALLQRQRFVY